MENAVQVTTREPQCAVFRLQPLFFLKAQLKKNPLKSFITWIAKQLCNIPNGLFLMEAFKSMFAMNWDR